MQNKLNLLDASVRHLGTDINYVVLGNLYDLLKDKLIYAGKQVNNHPVKDLLFISQIHGVYKDMFFSVVPSFVIQYKISENPDVFPDDLKNLTEESNPIIGFYRVKR